MPCVTQGSAYPDAPARSTVAWASGFGSQRRFNAAFNERYRLAPSALHRERAPALRSALVGPRLRLSYRPPYDAAGVMRYFADRAVAGVEAVDRDALSMRRMLAWQPRPADHRLAGRALSARAP